MTLNRFGNDVYKYEKDFDAIYSGKRKFISFSLRMESFASGKVFFYYTARKLFTIDLFTEKYFWFRHFQIIFLLVVRRIKQRKHATTNTVIIIIWPWNIRNTSFSHIWILLLIFPLFSSLFCAECWSDGRGTRTTVKQHCKFLRRTLNFCMTIKELCEISSSRGTCINRRELMSDVSNGELIAQRKYHKLEHTFRCCKRCCHEKILKRNFDCVYICLIFFHTFFSA